MCTCGRRVIQTLTDYLPFPDFFPLVRNPILELGNEYQEWTRGGGRGNGKDCSEMNKRFPITLNMIFNLSVTHKNMRNELWVNSEILGNYGKCRYG